MDLILNAGFPALVKKGMAMEQWYLFALAVVSTFAIFLNWGSETHFHGRRLRQRSLRIHVNGIRGKSTVTRIIAGLLREAGVNTVAKTTGSAACIISQDGTDVPIQRNGSPTILEQVEFINRLDSSVDGLVIECMAIKPEYQQICEDKIIQSNIGIITNVREDHQDILGESLEEIAGHLLSTCPKQGILITAERNPKLRPIFEKVARERGSELIFTDPESVTDEELRSFSYIAFKENVAIGMAVAELYGIDRETAIRGMVNAAPDPGVLRIAKKHYGDRRLTWADLFAVNDRESVINCVDKVSQLVPDNTHKIGLLNNRQDREHRAIQFGQIAAQDLQLDFVVLLGAYEKRVRGELRKNGVKDDRIIALGDSSNLQGRRLLQNILEQTDRVESANSSPADALIFGLVNIHTPQAESLRELFTHDEGAHHEFH